MWIEPATSSMRALFCIGLGLSAYLPSKARAQPQEPATNVPVMTLSEALSYSSTHQPEIRQALAEIAARQAEARIPRAAWFPKVGMQAQWLVGTTNNTTSSFVSVPGVDIPRVSSTEVASSTNWKPSPSALVGATATQQLFEFGRIAAEAAAADALTDVARANADTVKLDIALRVELAFNAVLAAKHILTATQEAYKRAEAHFRLADTGVRSGMRPPIDRTRAQADLSQAEVQRTRAEAGLTTARAALAAVIGTDDLEVDAAELKPGDRPFPGLDFALRLADQNSPELVAALARLHKETAQTSALTRGLLPNLYLSASLWGTAGGAQAASVDPPYGNGWLPAVGNYSLSLILQWRLLDPTLLMQRRASRSREAVARAAIDVTRRNIILRVQRSYLDLLAAQKTLPGLLARLDASKANLRQAEARFGAGLGTIVELTDAEALLVNSELELAVGQFNIEQAAAQLARSLGATPNP